MEDQKVVSTGLYGIVRHPMYTATIGMFLAMPLIMGSWWAFIVMIPYIPIIAIRSKVGKNSWQKNSTVIRNTKPGYAGSCSRVCGEIFL